MNDTIAFQQWHEDEKQWWDKHGHYMTYQWTLTPLLNRIIRTRWTEDFTNYLFKKNGTLLDMGCGGGWLSLIFGKKGMTVLGIDVSSEQIAQANKLKDESQLENISFECSDLIGWDCGKYEGYFDSVFVNAFLHHLPPHEIGAIFNNIAVVLKKGGRCYLYEPLTSRKKGPFIPRLTNLVVERFMGLCLGSLPARFDLWNREYKDQLKRGYSMRSPHEGPIEWTVFKRCLPDSVSVSETRGWHLYSLGWAMQIMSLKKSVAPFYTLVARVLYLFDRLVLATFDWKSFADRGRFVLCGIKLAKPYDQKSL